MEMQVEWKELVKSKYVKLRSTDTLFVLGICESENISTVNKAHFAHPFCQWDEMQAVC